MLNKKTGVKILLIISVLIFVFLFWGNFLENEAQTQVVCAGFCYNGPTNTNSGGCGTACGVGDPWTKYEWRVIQMGQCFLTVIGQVCSTGDKCIAGETGLRPGFCDCSFGGSIYRACCRITDNVPVSCINYAVQDPYHPPEGVCPPGSNRISTPSCPSGTPPPTPPPSTPAPC